MINFSVVTKTQEITESELEKTYPWLIGQSEFHNSIVFARAYVITKARDSSKLYKYYLCIPVTALAPKEVTELKALMDAKFKMSLAYTNGEHFILNTPAVGTRRAYEIAIPDTLQKSFKWNPFLFGKWD